MEDFIVEDDDDEEEKEEGSEEEEEEEASPGSDTAALEYDVDLARDRFH